MAEKEDGEEEERTMDRSMNREEGEETPPESSSMPQQEQEELISGMERLEVRENVTSNSSSIDEEGSGAQQRIEESDPSIDEEERQQDLWRMQILMQECNDEREDSEQEEDGESVSRIRPESENVEEKSVESPPMPSSSNSGSGNNKVQEEEQTPSGVDAELDEVRQESENDAVPSQYRETKATNEEESKGLEALEDHANDGTETVEEDSGSQLKSEDSEGSFQGNQTSDDTLQTAETRQRSEESDPSIDEEERQQDLWRMQILMQECNDEREDSEEEENEVQGEEPSPSADQGSENDVSPAQRREVRSDNADESEGSEPSDDDSETQRRSEDSEDPLLENPPTENTPQTAENEESDTETDAERERRLQSLLDIGWTDETETAEDVEYRNRNDEAMRRAMEELVGGSGGAQEPDPDVENQKVSSGDQAAEPASRVPQNSEPAAPSHPKIPISTRATNPFPPPREVSNPSRPTWNQWNVHQNSRLPHRHPSWNHQNDQPQVSETPPTYEQFSDPPRGAGESSCDDDAEFEEYTFRRESSGQPPRYNEQGRNRPFVHPFGGAPVNSVRQREQERRDEDRPRNQGPPPAYNDNRNIENFNHRWNGTSYSATNYSNDSQRSQNRNNGSRASASSGSGRQNRINNYGHDSGPPSSSGGRGDSRNRRREEFIEKPPMYPGGSSSCRATSSNDPPGDDFRDDRSRVSTSPDLSPERNPPRSQDRGSNGARNNNRRDHSPLTAANNYGYHPDPPMTTGGRNSRQSNRNQGLQDRSYGNGQYDRSPRNDNRYENHDNRQYDRNSRNENQYDDRHGRRPQDNCQHQGSQRPQQNHRTSSSTHNPLSHQPSCSEKMESEEDAKARRAEEDRLSREFIKNMGADEESGEAQHVSRYYENRRARGPDERLPPRAHRQNQQPNYQNQQWAPQQSNPGFNGPQQQSWGPQPQEPLPYHQNQQAPIPMAQYPGPQQNYDQGGNPQMPPTPQNMGYPQPNWNNGQRSSYPQNQNFSNMQGFPQNAPQPMGPPNFQQPPNPQMMMMMNPQFHGQQGPGPAYSGVSGGGSLPILNFTRETPPINIIRQIMDFLEAYKAAGIPVYISTMESPPNQIPQYFTLVDFIRQHLPVLAEIKPATNSAGQKENRVYLQ